MSKISRTIEQLKKTIQDLEPFADMQAEPPTKGTIYQTFNGSLVYVFEIDGDGDGRAIVLQGGHGYRGQRGEKPGEWYFVRPTGFYGGDGQGLVMSLRTAVPVDLSSYPKAASVPEVSRGPIEDEEGCRSLEDLLRRMNATKGSPS